MMEERGVIETCAPAGYECLHAVAKDGVAVVIMFIRREVATEEAKERIARGMLDRIEFYESTTEPAAPV
jgi:hypothetical protein